MKSAYIAMLWIVFAPGVSHAVECGRVLLASADLIASSATPRWQRIGTKLIDAGFLAPQNELKFPKVAANPDLESQMERLKSRAPGWVYLTFYARLYQRLNAVYGPETADQFLEATILRAAQHDIPQSLSPLMSANEIWEFAYVAGGSIAMLIRGEGTFKDKNREEGLSTFLTGALFEVRATLDPKLPPLKRLIAELENQHVECEESHRGGNLLCTFPGQGENRTMRVFPNRESKEKLADKDGYICITHREGNFPLLVAASPYRFIFETPGTVLEQVRERPAKTWEGGLLKLSTAVAKQTVDDINLIFEAMNQTSD